MFLFNALIQSIWRSLNPPMCVSRLLLLFTVVLNMFKFNFFFLQKDENSWFGNDDQLNDLILLFECLFPLHFMFMGHQLQFNYEKKKEFLHKLIIFRGDSTECVLLQSLNIIFFSLMGYEIFFIWIGCQFKFDRTNLLQLSQINVDNDDYYYLWQSLVKWERLQLN